MKGILQAIAFGLSLLFLAGCLGGVENSSSERNLILAGGGRTRGMAEVPVDWAELALPTGSDHDHGDPKQHANLSTPNFEIVGYDPVLSDYYGKTAGSYFCSHTAERDGRRLTVMQPFGSDVSFILLDTTDPSAPQKIGEFVMGNTQTYDVAITPDLRFVILGTSPLDAGPDDPRYSEPRMDSILFRDACTGEERVVQGPEQGLPWASGIVLVDITNPRVPAIADFKMFPVLGSHSVRAYDLDGRTLVISSVAQAHPGGYYVFMDIQDLNGPRLNVLSAYHYLGEDQTEPPFGFQDPCGPHDGLIQKHPVTGQLLAHLAYSCNGYVILDIDDLTRPVFVSRWADWSYLEGKQVPLHHLHEAIPIEGTWDGRHYTFVGEECLARTSDVPTCLLHVLDTTDPAKPTFVGAWTLPVDVQWNGGAVFSLHYIALSGRTLFVTAYHGGTWALDVSTPEALRTLPSIGVFLPTYESPKPPGHPPRSIAVNAYFMTGGSNLDFSPLAMDLDVLPDGTLLINDAMSGLYAVRFDATNPAPPPERWPLGYNE